MIIGTYKMVCHKYRVFLAVKINFSVLVLCSSVAPKVIDIYMRLKHTFDYVDYALMGIPKMHPYAVFLRIQSPFILFVVIITYSYML